MKRIALLAVTAALTVSGTAAAGPANHGAAAATAAPPVAHAACTRARVLGASKCIAPGQFCVHSSQANRDYHRYGLHCGKRDRNGRYHLVYS